MTGEFEKRSTTATAPAADFARLLDAVIAEAPLLVRQRQLLPAVDWKKASAEQVARLAASLAGAAVKLPAWLAQALLVAGHRLSAQATKHLSADLQVLSLLNMGERGTDLPDTVRQGLADLQASMVPEGDVATAIVGRLAALGEDETACRFALSQWQRWPAALRPVRQHVARLIETLPPLRLRVAGYATTHPLAEALVPALAAAGRRALVEEAGFGEVIADLMQPSGDFDARLVVLDFDGLYGNDWSGGLDAAAARAEQRLEDLARALATCASHAATPVLVNTLPTPMLPATGHVDRWHAAGAVRLVERTNAVLSELAAAHPSIGLVETDQALATIPAVARSDAKLAFYGRIPFTDEATRAIAAHFALAWQDRSRAPAKVLALDFDNTLWGGIFGDDGIDKLACGDDFPGNAFKALQQEALRLKAQGMLLVALSKNNADALDVCARHHGMALSADDFAATAVNWEPKPVNIERIARELNLGLDSFVFIDDSPHEREAMRRMCPAVSVPEMPADPALRPAWLRGLRMTWPVRLTEEDQRRSDMYIADRKAKSLKASAATFEDYLAGLEQRLVLADVGPASLARVAQLHQRTNQFNLTTRRFTEAELAALVEDARRAVVVQGRVADKFGDHGITIAAVATVDGPTARIDSFLMSCRVMGRQIETACLGALIDRLVALGATEISGDYLPTAKNGMVRDFYRAHGFEQRQSRDDGTSWRWCVGTGTPPRSAFVTVTWSEA